MKYLNQEEATNIDLELFNEYKYSVDQLMELAGLSCAHAVAKCYPQRNNEKPILILAGPGNNGGDGLVCARHLAVLGFRCTIYYPKRTDKELYRNLVNQCNSFGDSIRFVDACPSSDSDYSLIIDALFGFSFRPPVRESFLPIMRTLELSTVPIVRWITVADGLKDTMSSYLLFSVASTSRADGMWRMDRSQSKILNRGSPYSRLSQNFWFRWRHQNCVRSISTANIITWAVVLCLRHCRQSTN